MKNKILFILALFFIFLCFLLCNIFSQKPQEHKVLDILRADMFYVDLNDNNKIDENELIKLKDIYTFSEELNNFSIENSQKMHLDKIDYLKTGFIAQNWANDNLKGKNVIVKTIIEDKTKKYNYATLEIDGVDLAEFYLKNGLGFAFDNSDYSIYQNNSQIKNNAKEISKLNFVLLNLNSNIYHKLNCEFIDLMHSAKLILAKNANKYIPCKSCHETTPIPYLIPDKKELSLYKQFSTIEIYFTNPLIYKKPDNTCSCEVCKRLIKEIDNTKETIDIAIYGFGDIPKVFDALKKAKARGVKIRTIVDYSKKMDSLYPKTSDFIKEFDAKTDKNEIIMHNKFLIFDNKKLMTGSANISPSGIGGYSANSIAIIKSDKIIKRYKDEFEQMYKGNFSNAKEKFEIASSDNISAYFSPKDDIKSVIISKINSSKEEICISAFYLTNREIIDALISAFRRGVKIFIILDATSANNFKDRLYQLRKAGIALIVENWGGKDHEKTMLFDKKVLIMGSPNFSSAGLNKNDENMILIENEEIGNFYRNYFFYLFNSIDKKFLRLIPRSEGFDSINSCTDGIDNNFDGKTDSEDEGCHN